MKKLEHNMMKNYKVTLVYARDALKKERKKEKKPKKIITVSRILKNKEKIKKLII